MNPNDNLFELIPMLWRWKKHILWVTALAFAGSIIISLLLPNYYRSSTLFYPASPDLAKPAPVGDIEKDIDFYGGDRDLDRLLTIANSDNIADYIIDSFNLYNHYQINPDEPRAKFKIKKKFAKLFNASKTKYDAIEIGMEDKVPDTSALIVRAARERINKIAQQLIKSSQSKMLATSEQNITYKDSILLVLNDSLYRTRKLYDVYNVPAQGEVLGELLAKTEAALFGQRAKLATYKEIPLFQDSVAYLNGVVAGLEKQLSGIKSRTKKFNDGLSVVRSLERQINEFSTQVNLDQERYKQLKSVYNSDIPAIHLVQDAEVPVMKSRPKRSIYVIGATMAAFIFTLLIVLLLELFRGYNQKKE